MKVLKKPNVNPHVFNPQIAENTFATLIKICKNKETKFEFEF
jgi:hypothetical protein